MSSWWFFEVILHHFTSFYDGGTGWQRVASEIDGQSHELLVSAMTRYITVFTTEITRENSGQKYRESRKPLGPKGWVCLKTGCIYIYRYIYIHRYIYIYIHRYIYIYSIHLIPFNPNNPTANDNGPDKLWPSASFGNGSTRFFSQWLYEAPPSADASGISGDLERILRLHNLGVVTYFHTKFGILVSYVKIVKDS